MELKDFIQEVLTTENINGDVKEIERMITEIAQQRAEGNGCVAISDDEVRNMVINNAELSTKLAQEKAEKEAREKKEQEEADAQRQKEKEEREAKKKAERLEKKLEQERNIGNHAEQQSLF